MGRYQLVEEIGAGGMAVVYRARDTALAREVAVKVLYPHLLRREDHKKRFFREARAVAALDHPNVLRVHDVGGADDDGPAYIVMELVRGQTLKQFLDANGAPLAEAAALIGAVMARALAVAHAAGIVHRDVKPANVMLAEKGRLVLCDFGVARVADDDAIVTLSGAVVGTPAFMPPEQALGKGVDARSDVYSLGATLYQVATGHLPVAGPTPVVIAAIAKGEVVAPLRRNPAIGVGLARVIEKAMARDPAARHASAAELAEALEGFARDAGLGEPAAELAAYFAEPGAWNERVTASVIASSMTRARAAAERRQYALALALADRVLALAPGHAEANQLVASVGKGARTWRRAALAAGVAFIAAGVALGVVGWRHMRATAPGGADAGTAGLARDGAVAAASVADAAPVRAAPPDAGRAIASGRADAGRRAARPDAAVVVAVPRPPDAGLAVAPREQARVTVKIRPWCHIEIDGVAYGSSPRAAAIELAPGPHSLTCQQDTGERRSLTLALDLAPGERRVIDQQLFAPVEVEVQVSTGAARVGGSRLANGKTVSLAPGASVHVEILDGDKVVERRYVTIPPKACTLKDRPEIHCAPRP